jgi:hypothetical protein
MDISDPNFDPKKTMLKSRGDGTFDDGTLRTFDTGATRDTAEDKLDFEGFLSPLVLERYAEYMHENRKQSDGSLRDSDNWQKGIPMSQYIKSGWRHFKDWWRAHRGLPLMDPKCNTMEKVLCGLIFNASGYLHEYLKKKNGFLQPDGFTYLKENACQKGGSDAEDLTDPEPASECCNESTGRMPGLHKS